MPDLPPMPTPTTIRTEVKITFSVPALTVGSVTIHPLTDALLFDHEPSDDEVLAAQTARWNDWATMWLAPVSQEPPTDMDLLAQVSAQQDQAAGLIAQMGTEAQVAALTGVTQAVVDYTTTNLPDPVQSTVIAAIADQVQAAQG